MFPLEADDLDQCRISVETLHTQQDLTLFDHFLYAVLLVHRHLSLAFLFLVLSLQDISLMREQASFQNR